MKYVWLDCDPGHDDATAILLAIHCTNIELLGISTVHGNTTSEDTMNNAARCLYAFGAPDHLRIYAGANKPLIRKEKHDPEIHGVDGLGGVEGLPLSDHPGVAARLRHENVPTKAIEAIARAIQKTWNNDSGPRVTIISTGPMTNIALFISVYPELLSGVEEFVFMGGGVGVGNRAASAEYNILCDPEAAQIVLDAPVKTTMMPLNVTHTAIVTENVRLRLLGGSPHKQHAPGSPLPPAATPLRHTMSTLISYFAETYKATFGFVDGPPLHDCLTIAYVSRPDLFQLKRYRVDVELAGTHTVGETVVDIWNYRSCDDTWGLTGKNCMVAQSLNVEGFFDLLLDCVARCDEISPLNSLEPMRKTCISSSADL